MEKCTWRILLGDTDALITSSVMLLLLYPPANCYAVEYICCRSFQNKTRIVSSVSIIAAHTKAQGRAAS
jgi:hypothetical protein